MIRIYLTVSNVILNFITLKIAILANLTKKTLKIDKNICIVTIYKYVDTTYFIIGNLRIFATLTTVSTTISKLLSSI